MCSFQSYTSSKCTFITAEPFRVRITPYFGGIHRKKEVHPLSPLNHCTTATILITKMIAPHD